MGKYDPPPRLVEVRELHETRVQEVHERLGHQGYEVRRCHDLVCEAWASFLRDHRRT